jgi:hypothetical protein
LLFEATKQTSGEFVFTIWFKETDGAGQEHLPAAGFVESESEEEEESISVFTNPDDICLDEAHDGEHCADTVVVVDPDLTFPDSTETTASTDEDDE